jgi:molybdopterin molybdotransferase
VGLAVDRLVKPPIDPEEEAPLLPIDDYLAHILERIDVLVPTTTLLDDAWGCVLAEDVRAPRDLPPFVSSAMDGYAVRASDVAVATHDDPVALRIAGEVRIGAPPAIAVGAGEAITIATGAMVPDGADAVVPVELTARSGDDRVLVLRPVPSGKHVRPAGEDVRAGDVLVSAGRRLRAPDLGALAAAGCATVRAVPRATVGVVATGDELVRPGRGLSEGQIYDSNTFTVIGAVNEADAIALDGGVVRDDPGALTDALDAIADDVDAFVCSGGVSMGERDPVKAAFRADDAVAFFNVGMQPGRPQAFGSWRGKPLFGLPGNPISVFVSFEVFVRPALMKMMSRLNDARPTIDATLGGDLEAPRTRTRYARVKVRRDGDRYIATPEGGHQSNLLATFARADGLAVVPAGTKISRGERCRVLLIREV